MRDIKFRAWNRKTKKMQFFSLETLLEGYGTDDLATPPGEDPFVMTLWQPVMQFTGMKDKNGVEGYKDDFVRHPDHDVCRIAWGGPWNQAAFGLVGKRAKHVPGRPDITWDLLTPELMRWCEVIGNIHEHSHLLKNSCA